MTLEMFVSDHPKAKAPLLYQGAHTLLLTENVVCMNVTMFLRNLSPETLPLGEENLKS